MRDDSGPGPDREETFFRVDFPTFEMASLAVARLTSADVTSHTTAALAGIPSAVILKPTALSKGMSWYANLTLLVGHQEDRS
jgi:hypothetical protein